MHGHWETNENFHKRLGERLVKAGFVVAMPSFRAMGYNPQEESATVSLSKKGYTMMGVRVYEISPCATASTALRLFQPATVLS